MKILTAEQMRDADRLTTERYGVPSLTLMENAGTRVADYLLAAEPDLAAQRVVVLCGKGNNGGDGLVVARLLRERGAAPVVFLFAQPEAMRGDAAANLKRWQQAGGGTCIVTSANEWEEARGQVEAADLIIDALLGTGLTGPATGLLAEVIEAVNAASRHGAGGPQVVAVDMPSGLGAGADDLGGPVIAANATVTFTAPKLGKMVSPRAACVGVLAVREIGTPPEMLETFPEHFPVNAPRWLEPAEFRGLPMVRRRDANKGSYGHALVVAGSFGKSGAAVLAGRAALRAGVGLVTVATPREVLAIVAAGMPELMTVPLIETNTGTVAMSNMERERLEPLLNGKSVVAIGPGLTTDSETQRFVRTLVATTSLPVILDADGLNAFDGHADLLGERKTPLLALTPHPGEMARLLGIKVSDVQARRLEIALEAAAWWRAYVVLKGFHTILATPDGRAYVNTTGNPGMATGGTGDVLTGMLAGLTAEFGPERWAAVLGFGIYLHGLAGDLAAARLGEAPLVASDLIEELPAAFAQLLKERESGAV